MVHYTVNGRAGTAYTVAHTFDKGADAFRMECRGIELVCSTQSSRAIYRDRGGQRDGKYTSGESIGEYYWARQRRPVDLTQRTGKSSSGDVRATRNSISCKRSRNIGAHCRRPSFLTRGCHGPLRDFQPIMTIPASNTVGILQCNPIQSAILRDLIGQIFATAMQQNWISGVTVQ
jgi:hypothetical protein